MDNSGVPGAGQMVLEGETRAFPRDVSSRAAMGLTVSSP